MQNNLFKGFVTASGLTNLADGIATVAWAWLASLLTRDPLLISIVPVALRLPWFLCAIPAGIITDRIDRKSLVLWMDIIRMISFSAAGIGVWIALPIEQPPSEGVSNPALFATILIAAFLIGIAEVFRDNAAQTMLPSMVSHDNLEKANGRLWAVELVGNALIGPAFGAFLIGVALPLPFAVNAVAFIAAVWIVWRLSGDFKPESGVNRNWRRELMEGFRFVKDAPLLRTLALLTGFWNLLFQIVLIALILHVQENLGFVAQTYGLVLTAGAIGGILGGWYGEHIIRRIGPGRTAKWMLFASAPAFFAIACAPGALSLAIVLALLEFSGLVWNTVTVSYRQRIIPNQLLGRVNSLYRLMAWGMMPVGLIMSGLIVRTVESVSTREVALLTPFLVAGSGALLLAAVGWKPLGQGFENSRVRPGIRTH
ncbi:MAG: MFS transporter [Planctomycetaceae bacterium]|nr:MFS transporter [Planctomycetaceae bacterium]